MIATWLTHDRFPFISRRQRGGGRPLWFARHDSFDPFPGPFVPTIVLSPPDENLGGQTLLFFLFVREPFSFVDAKSMQLPVRYHAGAHLTGELV